MHDLFSDSSPFVLQDSRNTRPVLPTTAALLNRKHNAILPAGLTEGRTVLDLGCCIGATGHWCLSLGAAHYTGVELQDKFAAVARELLSDWQEAEIVTSDSELFLRDARRYDIVCMLGLVHGVYDPLALIRMAANKADKYVCFEDFGRANDLPVLVAEPQVRMPVAGEAAGSVGFGWSISPGAMEHIMAFLGFEPDMTPLFIAEHRWMCRYIRARMEEGEAASYSSRRITWT